MIKERGRYWPWQESRDVLWNSSVIWFVLSVEQNNYGSAIPSDMLEGLKKLDLRVSCLHVSIMVQCEACLDETPLDNYV
jgi:hypothetical protein